MNSSVDDGMLIAAPGSGEIYRSPICVSTSATPKQRADAKARATAAPVIGTTPICKAHSCCADRDRWRGTPAASSLRPCGVLQSIAHAPVFTERCALASIGSAIGRHCCRSDIGWAASSIRPDMIFGKDKVSAIRSFLANDRSSAPRRDQTLSSAGKSRET